MQNNTIYVINLQRTREKLLPAACASVALENPADVSRILANELCWNLLPPLKTLTPVAGCFPPRTFPNKIQSAFQEPQPRAVSDPRAGYLASHRVFYVNLPPVTLGSTDSALWYVDIAIPYHTRECTHWVWCVGAGLVISVLMCHHFWLTPMGGQAWVLLLQRDCEEIEKEDQAAAKKAITMEGFRVNGWFQFLIFLLLNLVWSCAGVLVPIQQFPDETGLQFPLLRPPNG